MKALPRFIGSRRLGLALVASWVFYYLTATVWGEEAFAGFVKHLKDNPLFQGLFVLFLLNFALRTVARIRESGLRRLPVLVTTVFRLGLLLLLTGFLVSVTTKQMIRPLVGERDVIAVPWSERTFPVERVRSSIRGRMLDIDTGEGLFTMEPELILNLDDRRVRVGAFPPARIGRTWMHVLQTGLAPGIRLRRDGRIVREGYAALRLLPPGSTDSFELNGSPYSFLLKLAPERKIRKGGVEAGVYDLTRPLYDVRVLRAGTEIARARSDASIRFDGLSLDVFDTDHWVLLDVVRDDGIPLVAAGLFLLAAGLLLMGARIVYRAGSLLWR